MSELEKRSNRAIDHEPVEYCNVHCDKSGGSLASVNLAGKEYFTQKEAAAFCCVSHSHFRAKAAAVGLPAGKFWGRLVYRRSDLLRLIEQETVWPPEPASGRDTRQRPMRRRRASG